MKKDEERFVLVSKKVMDLGSVVIDRETGVNYLWFPSTGISPLYNSDGTIIVTPISEIK